MSGKYEPAPGLGRFVHELEETFIAILLGLMTVITFVNVILRYVFNSSLIWFRSWSNSCICVTLVLLRLRFLLPDDTVGKSDHFISR